MNTNKNINILTQRSINAKKTKDDLFNSALFLFTKYGYDKATVEKIAKHAGVSKGNFYTHFESKESVFIELFHRIDEHYIETFKNVDKNETASNKLRILINSMCDYCYNECGIDAIKIVYANQISISKNIKILNNKDRPFYIFLKNIVNEGQFNKEFRIDISSEDLVEIISRFFRSLLYEWCLYDNEFNLLNEADKYMNFILHAIKYQFQEPSYSL